MVVTNYAKENLALQLARSGTIPQFLAIGSGSGAAVAGLGSLVAEVGSRIFFTNRDISTSKKVTYSYSKSSVAMSGVFLREYGIGAGSVVGEQDLWNREAFDEIEFDGSIEAEFETVFEVF
jgi:hypothetical protein